MKKISIKNHLNRDDFTLCLQRCPNAGLTCRPVLMVNDCWREENVTAMGINVRYTGQLFK